MGYGRAWRQAGTLGLGFVDEGLDAAKAGRKIHGNSFASTKPTTLYQLVDKATGEHLKWGISSALDRRYSRGFLEEMNAEIIPIATGSRRETFQMERWFSERLPGRLNKETWYGTKEFPFFFGH